jgi:KDO2-lipid IV(A) lauroyltransferase
MFLARLLPDAVIGFLIEVVGRVFCTLLYGPRRQVASNLEPVLGPAGAGERRRRAWRSIRAFSWVLTERYQRGDPRRTFESRFEGLEHWESAAAGERGFVLVTAHVGAWELGSAIPSDMGLRRVHLVREGELDPRTQRFTEELVRRAGGEGHVTHFADGDPSLGVTLLEALRAGDVVALQGDRPRAGGRALAVPFRVPHGEREIDLPVGTASLARAADVPLLPVFCFREGLRSYRVVFRAPIHVEWSGDARPAVRAALERVGEDLAWAVAEEPHQWFCFGSPWADPSGR